MRTNGMWAWAVLALAGCGGGGMTGGGAPSAKAPALSEAEVRAAEFAKMEPAERAVAEAQGYCVVSEEPLGSMGVPYKVSIDTDRAVYVCCKGCEDLVKEKPDEMLAKADELRKKVASEKGQTPADSAPDQPAAAEQVPDPNKPAADQPPAGA
jgi:hypothetical protein